MKELLVYITCFLALLPLSLLVSADVSPTRQFVVVAECDKVQWNSEDAVVEFAGGMLAYPDDLDYKHKDYKVVASHSLNWKDLYESNAKQYDASHSHGPRVLCASKQEHCSLPAMGKSALIISMQLVYNQTINEEEDDDASTRDNASAQLQQEASAEGKNDASLNSEYLRLQLTMLQQEGRDGNNEEAPSNRGEGRLQYDTADLVYVMIVGDDPVVDASIDLPVKSVKCHADLGNYTQFIHSEKATEGIKIQSKCARLNGDSEYALGRWSAVSYFTSAGCPHRGIMNYVLTYTDPFGQYANTIGGLSVQYEGRPQMKANAPEPNLCIVYPVSVNRAPDLPPASFSLRLVPMIDNFVRTQMVEDECDEAIALETYISNRTELFCNAYTVQPECHDIPNPPHLAARLRKPTYYKPVHEPTTELKIGTRVGFAVNVRNTCHQFNSDTIFIRTVVTDKVEKCPVGFWPVDWKPYQVKSKGY